MHAQGIQVRELFLWKCLVFRPKYDCLLKKRRRALFFWFGCPKTGKLHTRVPSTPVWEKPVQGGCVFYWENYCSAGQFSWLPRPLGFSTKSAPRPVAGDPTAWHLSCLDSERPISTTRQTTWFFCPATTSSTKETRRYDKAELRGTVPGLTVKWSSGKMTEGVITKKSESFISPPRPRALGPRRSYGSDTLR